MPKQFYVVNAGRFGGTSRTTHIMYSRSPSTPNPRSGRSHRATAMVWRQRQDHAVRPPGNPARGRVQTGRGVVPGVPSALERAQAPAMREIRTALAELGPSVDEVIAGGSLPAMIHLRTLLEGWPREPGPSSRAPWLAREIDAHAARVAAAETAGTASATPELARIEREIDELAREIDELAAHSREQARANPSAEMITGAQIFAVMTELGHDACQSDSEIARKVGVSEKATRNLRQVWQENPDLHKHYGAPDE